MNVLIVVPWDQESGGVAAVVGYLARHLESEGHRVLFLHPGSSDQLREKRTKWGFRGVELKLRAPFNPRFPIRSVIAFALTFPFTLVQLLRLLRREKIGIINIHYPGEHFIVFAVCRWLLSLRLAISIHGMDTFRWESASTFPSPSLRLLFRAADLVIAPSWRFLRRCDPILDHFPARRVAIHNGTDLVELCAEAEEMSKTPFILTVCSLDPWKGVDVLVRAMAMLPAGSPQLFVAGEGPARADLESLIFDLGLRDRVRLLGNQDRAAIVRLLNDCTLFVLASRFETFGIAVIEAMAAGRPVIGTAVDGILEIIDDGDTGIIVPSDDPAALARAIETLLADASLRDHLGKMGRALVERQFQRVHMGVNYTRTFREVLQRGA